MAISLEKLYKTLRQQNGAEVSNDAFTTAYMEAVWSSVDEINVALDLSSRLEHPTNRATDLDLADKYYSYFVVVMRYYLAESGWKTGASKPVDLRVRANNAAQMARGRRDLDKAAAATDAEVIGIAAAS